MDRFLVIDDEWPIIPERLRNLRRKDLGKVIGDLSGWRPVIRHHAHIKAAEVERERFRAIILSGCGTNWTERPAGIFGEVHELIRRGTSPVLGICGGHQLIAFAYSCPVDWMRPVRPGETDTGADYKPGFFKERGYLPVTVLDTSPLFAGLPRTIVVSHSHAHECKCLPAGFRLLASTDECRVQAMQSQIRPVFGVQFHPERHNDAHPHGRRILQNFIRYVESYWRR